MSRKNIKESSAFRGKTAGKPRRSKKNKYGRRKSGRKN
tara:strand:- start:321 stop:434 length:114 start_codon:yes stop_codon:yes gene_type:complete